MSNEARKYGGSMLIFALAGFVMAILFIFVGLSFGSLFFVHSQVQKFADDIALAGASRLNDNDRLGQMNNLVARCRQLVYASRETAGLTINSTPDVQMLAQQLLDESRKNAQDLEAERLRLQSLSVGEATAAMNTMFDGQSDHYCFTLAWLRAGEPHLMSMQFGNVLGIDSNVTPMTYIPALVNYDQSKHLINVTTGLYSGNIDASLAGMDKDLHFKLSSLAAPVNNQISPARLMQDNMLQPGDNNQLNSAVRIQLNMQISADSSAFPGTYFVISSTAATSGAAPFVK